jgi:hypothetical protein
MPELCGGEMLFRVGRALYKPANARMVSRTSTFLFMGEVSLRELLRVAKYMPRRGFRGQQYLWITVERCAAEISRDVEITNFNLLEYKVHDAWPYPTVRKTIGDLSISLFVVRLIAIGSVYRYVPDGRRLSQ